MKVDMENTYKELVRKYTVYANEGYKDSPSDGGIDYEKVAL